MTTNSQGCYHIFPKDAALFSDTGCVIVVEGVDGTGKTTLVQRLAGKIGESRKVIIYKEPVAVQQFALDKFGDIIERTPVNIHSPLETAYKAFLATRVQNMGRDIQKLVDAGYWVVVDRYVGSTFAYNASAKARRIALQASIEQHAVRRPNYTLCLNPSPEQVRPAYNLICDRILRRRNDEAPSWDRYRQIVTTYANLYREDPDALVASPWDRYMHSLKAEEVVSMFTDFVAR